MRTISTRKLRDGNTLRRLLHKQLKAVAESQEPAGVSFDADAQPVNFSAGNFLVEGA